MQGVSVGFLLGIMMVLLGVIAYYIYERDFSISSDRKGYDIIKNKTSKKSKFACKEKVKKLQSCDSVQKTKVNPPVKEQKKNIIVENESSSYKTTSRISTDIEEVDESQSHYIACKDFQKNYIRDGQNKLLHKFVNIATVDSLYHTDIENDLQTFAKDNGYNFISIENLTRSLLFYLKMHMKNFMEYYNLKVKEGGMSGPQNITLTSEDKIYDFFTSHKYAIVNNVLYVDGEAIVPKQKVSIDILYDKVLRQDSFIALITHILQNVVKADERYLIFGIDSSMKFFTGAPVKILFDDSYENRFNCLKSKKGNLSGEKIKNILSELDKNYLTIYEKEDGEHLRISSGENLGERLSEYLDK